MNKNILLGLGVFAVLTSTAMADVTGYAGKKGGAYDSKVTRLLATFGKDYGKLNKVNTDGSFTILENVNDNPNGFGLAQADVLASCISQNKCDNVEILGNVNKECVFFIANTNSGIDDEDDLVNKRVLVGNKGSGAEGTLNFMRQLDSDYKTIAMEYGNFDVSLQKLAGNTKDYDVLMFVATPSIDNKYFKIISENKNLKIFGADDYSMNDKLPSGESIYTFETVDVAKGLFNDVEVTTACTNAVLVANKEAPFIESLANTMLTNKAILQQ